MSTLWSSTGRGFWVATRGTCLAVAVLVSGAFLTGSLPKLDAKVSRDSGDDDSKAGAKAPLSDARVVQLDRGGQEKGGIESSPPVPAPYQDLVRAYGSVLALDRLTVLFNASLTDAAQLQAAEAKLKASSTANERAKGLLKVFTTAMAQAEAAQATYQLDIVGVATAKAQIEALRNASMQEWGPVLGDAVADRTELAANLVRRKTVLVQISLQPGAVASPPRRLAFATGTSATVEGQLISEATQIDPKMQSPGFLYAVPATPGLLPGASILARLPKGDAQPGVDIPSSAVVWQAGKPWLYLRTAPDMFERHAIEEGAAPTPDGGYILPAKSLPRDKPVVVAGAQILLSQEMRAQIPSDEDDN